jgi:PKD repeat protein
MLLVADAASRQATIRGLSHESGARKTTPLSVRARAGALCGLLVIILAAAPGGKAGVLPSGFSDSAVVSNLSFPTAVRFAPDGRVFVAEKSGLIKVFDNFADTTPSVYADLRTNVYNGWDRGLLDIELDPSFPTNPYVYALYTFDAPIGGTAPYWGSAGANSDPCPTPPGPAENGCVVSARVSRLAPPSSGSYSQVVFGDNPLLYWRLSEGSGAFLDQTANHNDASASGTGVARSQPSLLTSDSNASVKFTDGSSSVIDPTVIGLPSDRISVEAWIKTNGNANWIDYVKHAWGGTGGQGWNLFSNSAGTLTWGLYQSGGPQIVVTAPGLIKAGTVYHVVGTYDGSALRLFANGQQVASAAVGALALNNTVTGVNSGNTDTSAGVWIDEVAVYPTALSAAQVLAHFNAGTQPASANPGGTQEQVLIEDWCQQYMSHSIGTMKFGADGALYVGGGEGASFNFIDYGQKGIPLNPCGDPPVPVGGTQTLPTAEGGSFRSQDLRTSGDPVTLDGTIIRVDPATGAPLPSNPLYGSADANARRVIAYGLRNPFRFTFRPGTNEIWLGDVGGGPWEEINRIVNPTDSTVENFGWPCYLGNGRQTGFEALDADICTNLYAQPGASVAPYYTYNHQAKIVAGETCPTGSSAISGVAFSPAAGPYPSTYAGALFFADYARNCIWVMPKGANGLPDPASVQTFDAPAAAPVDLEIGPGGDVYYVDLLGGTIRRIHYTAGDQPPTAVATASPTSGPVPLTVNFDGTNSSDPDSGGALTYAWDLDGDGAYDDSTASKPTYTYSTAGDYTVRLRVTDSGGASDVSDPLVISAGNTPPIATILTPSSATTWKVGDVMQFSGSGMDSQDGSLPSSALAWTLIMHHCPSTCHSHILQTFSGTASGSFTAPDHEYPSYLELQLTATDSKGLRDTKSVRLDPQTVVLSFDTTPSGLQLAVNTEAATTPHSQTVITGSTNTVSAPTPQTSGGTTYVFSSWSDGGAQSHEIVANSNKSFTAAYVAANYRNTVLGDSPFLFWRLGEVSGTFADDSGNNNSGTLAGTGAARGQPTLLAGDPDGSVKFTDATTRIDNGTLVGLPTSSISAEAWFKTGAHASWIDYARHAWGASNGHGWSLFSDANGKLSWGLWTSGGPQLLVSYTGLITNTVYYAAGTYDGDTLRLYVDGALVASRAIGPKDLNTTNRYVATGSVDTTAGVWIDDVALYGNALDAARIATHYQVGAG